MALGLSLKESALYSTVSSLTMIGGVDMTISCRELYSGKSL